MEFKVRGVKLYKSRGKLYAYHRATGKRIKAAIGTAAFLAEIERLDAKKPPDAKPGTLGALIAAYRASPEFTELAPRTRTDYQHVFDYLKPLDSDLLIDFTPSMILDTRDAAFKAHKRRFANYVVSVLRLLFKWGTIREMLPINPALGVEKLRRPRNTPKANRPWDDDECAAVIATASGGVKVAIALGMWTGMREGDAVTAPRSAYIDGWLAWHQRKTGDLVEIPVDARLKAILDPMLAKRKAAEQKQEGGVAAMTLVIGERGQPYTENGFRAMFFRLVKQLEAEGKVRPGLTFHGLRHTAGRTLAENGAEPRMIATLLGHKTLAMAAHYSDEANRKKLAKGAVAKLRPKTERKMSNARDKRV